MAQVTRDKADLMEEKERAYEEFVATIASFDDAQLEFKPEGKNWTPKDIVVHVAFWESFLSKMLVAWLVEGTPFPGFNAYDGINAYSTMLRSSMDFSKVFQELEIAHLDVLRIVEELISEESLDQEVSVAYPSRTGHRPLAELLTDYIEHFSEHATQLRAML